jgi:hypothetical protein
MKDEIKDKKPPFLMLQRNKAVQELLKKPDCFILLTQIAIRAKRTDEFSIDNLKIGESLVGDFRNIGLTERRYRTAKIDLQKWGLASFQATNRGTIAKLVNSTIYDINEETDKRRTKRQTNDEQKTSQETDKEEVTKLVNSTICDINEEAKDGQSDRQTTSKRRTRGGQATTNNNIINKELKELNNTVDDIYKNLANGLRFVLEAKINKVISSKNWHNEIRLLIENDLKPRHNPIEDVKIAIQAIANNYGKDYFPIIQSASSLRKKFDNIEAYIKRESPKKSNREIYNNLKNEFENE